MHGDRGTQPEPNLIYDVGIHKGEDTQYYLKKGFKVVGFEADPDLVEICRNSFVKAIKAQKLRIAAGAIVPDPATKHVVFYKYDERSRWGTIDLGLINSSAKRAAGVTEIKVPTIDFASVLSDTGVPYYMKIDIERADIHCLEALHQFEAKPKFVSIEAVSESLKRQKQQIELLAELGYVGFKAVPQARMHLRGLPIVSTEGRHAEHRFSKGSSGPFGSDLGGKWLSRREIISEYETIFARNRRFTRSALWKVPLTRKLIRRAMELLTNTTIPGWYDTHARHASCAGAR